MKSEPGFGGDREKEMHMAVPVKKIINRSEENLSRLKVLRAYSPGSLRTNNRW